MKTVKLKKISLILIIIVIAIIILASMTFVSSNLAYAQSVDFKFGEGTKENPYQISNSKELNNVRYHRDAYFLQTANIDMSNYENFAQIGSIEFPFKGKYDGGKYSIFNLNIESTDNNVGLFSYIRKGEITNLKIKDSSIKGAYNVGAIVGINQGTIMGCIVNCQVNGTGAVGGIAGLNSGVIKECANLGVVKSNDDSTNGKYIGGISGINNKIIQDSYNLGDIGCSESQTTYSGGIAGRNGSSSIIEKSFTASKVGGRGRGEIVGDNLTNANIKNCFWQTSELNIVAGFTRKEDVSINSSISKQAFSNAKTFASWQNFDDLWMYIDGNDYPILRREYISVESVSFESSNVELKPGETYKYCAAISPEHATLQNINYDISGDKEQFEIDLASQTVTVKETATIGCKIHITATAENCKTTQSVMVVKIPVERVEIINESGLNEISAATSLKFKGVVYPDKATYKEVLYRANSSFADITNDGVLTIKENAPIGIDITVTAISANDSNIYATTKVTTTKVKTEKVKITSESKFKVTQSLELTATIYPIMATDKNITFEIVSSTAKGAQIIGNSLYADGLGEITIRALSGGVYSENYNISVLKEPVVSIEFDIADNMLCGEAIALSAKVKPNNATNKNITYAIVSGDGKAEIIDGTLYAYKEGTLTISAMADEVATYKTVTINKIGVQSLLLMCEDSFKHTECMKLDAMVMPRNATYNEVTYSIINDTANAYISGNTLYAKNPGHLTIRAEADGVYDEKIITVLKESVVAVTIVAEYVQVKEGEALQFQAEVYPKNATYKTVEYYIASGPATITQDGLLIIDSSAEIGSEIIVYASADGINSKEYKIVSGKIDVNTVKLRAESNIAYIGESILLEVTTDPIYVSNPGIKYEINGDAEIINNELCVNNTLMIGKTIEIVAIVDGVRSNAISVLVEKTAAQAISFTCSNNFKITEFLQLSAKVFPSNATFNYVGFEIISRGDTKAYIKDSSLYAENEGEILIRATADGVSKELKVTAMKEPVANLVLNSAKSVKVYDDLYLSTMVYPSNATYKDVRYELINNDIDAKIIDDKIFYCENIGVVSLRVFADDIYKDYEIEVTKEPVVNIILNCASIFKHTESLVLSASVLPRNATNNSISYEITQGTDFAWIENGILYATHPGIVTINFIADGFSKDIDIEVVKESVTDIVLDGTDEICLNKGFRLGEIPLKSKVYPINATYSDVEYNIISCGDNCVAYIDNGYLKVNLIDLAFDKDGYAKKTQSAVTVSSTADGITTYRTYIINKEEVKEITLSNRLEAVKGEFVDIEEMTFKTSGKMHITVNILSEYATCNDYRIFIGGKEVDSNKDNIYEIARDLPDKVLVVIESLCDPSMTAKFEFVVEVEPVKNVYLGLEVVENDNDKDKITKIKRGDISTSANASDDDVKGYCDYSYLEVQQSSGIMLRAFANAENLDLKATYGDIGYLSLYYVVDGIEKQFTDKESNDYFSYNGSILTTKSNAPVNKSFYIYAKEENSNVESERTEIKIQSQYILDINNTTIDSNGLVNGLSSLYNSANNISIIEKVAVKITHTSGIIIEKTIVTKDPSLRLQLYNPVLGGSFAIEYTVYFNESGNRYNYVLPKVKSFDGLKATASNQSPENEANAIIFFDFSNSDFYGNTNFGRNVKAIYVYGTGGKIYRPIVIDNATDNRVDMYLNNINIKSTFDSHGIEVKNNGDFRLTAIGDIFILGGDGFEGDYGSSYNVDEEVKDRVPNRGGDGGNGGDGGTGIMVMGNLEIVAEGQLRIVGGYGGDGGSGGNGEGSDTEGIGCAGFGGHGGDGGNGGRGIMAKGTLVLNGDNIQVDGGDGGYGGYGGDGGKDTGDFSTADSGGDGGNGGRGGDGGDGIYATYIEIKCASLDINSGYGGDGGDGGNGGKTRLILLAGQKAYRGAGGAGGDGGDAGNGIVTYSNISHSCNINLAGDGGSRGTDGGANNSDVKVRPNSNTDGVSGNDGQSIKKP